jgi:hypothetical protein
MFYYNLPGNIGMIKHMGIIGNNDGEVTLVQRFSVAILGRVKQYFR